jgi:disease resistance protein
MNWVNIFYFLSKLKQVSLSLLGSQAKVMNSKPLDMDISAPTDTNVPISPAPAKKVVDINEPQTCKNPGCGKTFKEKDNHETACDHHPGPAVFHDRMRGVRYIYIYF